MISLLLFAAAAWFWQRGDVLLQRERNRPGQTAAPRAGDPSAPTANVGQFQLRSAAVTPRASAPASTNLVAAALAAEASKFPFRLRNTAQSIGELTRLDTAVLLQNALIDTASGTSVEVPAHLRADENAGSYIVQSRGVIGDRFRAALRGANATPVAYIPNNAWLVRATAEAARGLAGSPAVQAVLPFDPYFKLDEQLLPLAARQESLPADMALRLVLFPNARDAAAGSLTALGVEVVAEDRSPFGPVVIVNPSADSLVALARLSAVQGIEVSRRRELMNDLTRVRLGVSTNTSTGTNYLGLTGKGVFAGLNDSGADASHPDLAGRLMTSDTNSFTLVDLNGHGTHVAGTMASSGKSSSTVKYASGSATNADFRGKAPEAKLFVLPIDLRTGPLISDAYVQETAARTNAFVSNNSWGYPGTYSYSSFSASYDAAVRDALPGVSGEQPILYIFAAGNAGEGNDDGRGGIPATVSSPGNAKNVLTVGATESPRSLTNSLVFTNVVDGTNMLVTNQIYLGMTDTRNEIASYSSRGNVGIGTEGDSGRFKPDVVAPGSFILSTRSSLWPNADPDSFDYDIQHDFDQNLGPLYRYESGTSMATPAVSGVMILLQEFFEQRLRQTNSPALMKALVINGARSLGSRYNFNTKANINYQGWGLMNLTNALPGFYNGYAGKTLADINPAVIDVPHFFVDQSAEQLAATNLTTGRPKGHALATGQTETFDLKLTDDGQLEPLRVTLVWTDPPGNPAAAVKLVNDLDLVVSNTLTHEVFYGNDIVGDRDFNQGHDTNAAPVFDVVNNVENVYLEPPLGSNYVVSVTARRVNVNAVVANTTAIVQDYALVISSGNGSITNCFRVSAAKAQVAQPEPLMAITNGVALLNQRVGANFPLTNLSNGQAEQWHFYVFTNLFQESTFGTMTNGSNVAFVTFLPPNLGRPRNVDADVDLYVSTNSALTNLDAAAISNSFKATGRDGSQLVFFTNAVQGAVYYVGVKSEDQQGGEYALYGLSTDEPFTTIGPDGVHTLRGFPVRMPIPDGSPGKPGAATIVAIGIAPVIVGKATAHNEINHESIGDLIGNLSHNGQFVVLNNHFLPRFPVDNRYYYFDYDDSQSGASNATRPTDGPGSLNNFLGQDGSGLWLLSMVDNAPSQAGTNYNFSLRITPSQNVQGELEGLVQPNRWDYYLLQVPVDAISVTISLGQMSGPLDLYIRGGDLPTLVTYDKMASLNPPGGSLTQTINDVPPLNPGRYFVGVFNPNAVPVTYRIVADVVRNPRAELSQGFSSTNRSTTILDQAVTTATVFVDDDRPIVEARVGVVLEHPRLGDLAIHIVSPEGTRVLLTENRGGLETNGYGRGGVFATFTDNTNLTTELIKFASPPFSTNSTVITNLISGFEGLEVRAYNERETLEGWLVEDIFRATNSSTGGIIRSAPTVFQNAALAHSGSNYLALGRSEISRAIPTRPGETYTLTFAYRASGTGTINAQILLDGSLNSFITGSTARWQTKSITFVAANNSTRLNILPALNNPGMLLDTFQLIENGGSVYYRPEESLDILRGESALGTWTLEITDTRAGPTNEPARLLNWQVQLVLARVNAPAVRLEPGVPVTSTVSSNEIKYFIVDVPREALMATNVVNSLGDMVLLYSPSGLPSGNLPNDVVVDDFGPGGEFLILNTNAPPVLQPGQRYYLGVANFNPGETNDFTIQVDFGLGPNGLIQPTLLRNGVAVTNTIAATNTIQYYQFNVSSNAYSTTFELSPRNGDVDLIIRQGRGTRDPLPTMDQFDYSSSETGTNADIIVVTTNSVPVTLGPGPWYIGVVNRDTNQVTYTLRVTEALNPFLIIPLRDGVPVNVTTSATNTITNFFVFHIEGVDSNATARFDLYNLSGSAGLYINRDFLFNLDEAMFRTNSGIYTATRFNLTATEGGGDINGDWYMQVGGFTDPNLSFTIRATLYTNSEPRITTLTNAVASTNLAFGNPLTPNLDFYRFNVSTNAKFVTFELFPELGNVDLLVTRGPKLPATDSYDYGSFNMDTNEVIRVGLGSKPVSLAPGEWFLAVQNNEKYVARYRVRATETPIGFVATPVTNTSIRSLSVVGVPDYYRITLPPRVKQASFQAVFPDGIAPRQVRFYLNRGLPLPSPSNFHYESRLASGVTEALTIDTTSTPVPVSAGDWYITVVNSGVEPVEYVFSYQYEVSPDTGGGGGTNVVVDRSGVLFTNGTFCLSWVSTPNASYAVEGKPDLTQTNWVAVAGPLVATTTNTTYCVPAANTNRFFRVVGSR